MSHVRQAVWVSVDGVVRDAIERNLRNTALSFDSYTARVVDHYLKTIPVNQRTYPVNVSGDVFADNRLNSRKLARTINLDGDLRMPAVLLPSLLAALDEPWRSDAQTAVANLLSPRKLHAVHAPELPLDSFQRLLKENNEALSSFMAVARDGFSDDTTVSLMDARVQLLQLMDAAERAVGLLNDELAVRGVKVVG